MQFNSIQELIVGSVVVYKLKPKDLPTNPNKEWRGRVKRIVPVYPKNLTVIVLGSLEEGYEEYEEYILPEQIVRIEKGPVDE